MPVSSAAHSEFVTLERQRKVSELYREGYSQHIIAQKVGVGISTVCSDIRAIKDLWLSLNSEEVAAKVVEQLAKLDRIEEQAWKAWHRSCEPAVINHKKREAQRQAVKTDETTPDGKPKYELKLVPTKIIDEETQKGQAGDPRFLDQVMKCVEMRLKVMGALKPDQNNSTVNILRVSWDELLGRPKETDADMIEAKISNVRASNGEGIQSHPPANGTERKA